MRVPWWLVPVTPVFMLRVGATGVGTADCVDSQSCASQALWYLGGCQELSTRRTLWQFAVEALLGARWQPAVKAYLPSAVRTGSKAAARAVGRQYCMLRLPNVLIWQLQGSALGGALNVWVGGRVDISARAGQPLCCVGLGCQAQMGAR